MPLEVETPHGLARVYRHAVDRPRAALVLGHGAGGGVGAGDLVAVTEVALSENIAVARVEQPYRVSGRRSPAPVAQLDAAWVSVVEHLRDHEFAGLPLLVGGRSLGARVACRTAASTGAVAVLCLAFPLLPPRRGGTPPRSRLDELEAVTVPVLVVQGERDPFGMPPAGPSRKVLTVPGNHALTSDLEAVRAAVRSWLKEVVATQSSTR